MLCKDIGRPGKLGLFKVIREPFGVTYVEESAWDDYLAAQELKFKIS